LYRLLTGHHHLTGQPTTRSLTREQVAHARARLPVPDLPSPVNTILERALSPAPEARYPTARAFQEALEGLP
ncbi:MAG: hypothetical protein R3185_04940, partial [Candidatus Thermoplasmatota archaeon]|nr:hypothetical protein [Candidatus Thermoplasmatota archaeon]